MTVKEQEALPQLLGIEVKGMLMKIHFERHR